MKGRPTSSKDLSIMKTLFPAGLGMLLVAAALPTAAHAQNEDSDGITVSGSATVVSDYRFRGFSQSNEEAAIQGGITVSHDSGLYLGTWGSSIGFANGTEIDVFGGYAREIAPRSEEHTSELQSLMRISYAVFCLKKKTHTTHEKAKNIATANNAK